MPSLRQIILGLGLAVASINLVAAEPGLLVGYLDLSASPTPNIQAAVAHGYNVVVVGWGVVNPDDTAGIYPATLSNEDDVPGGLAGDIAKAHDAQAKVFLTFGGEDNTFNPPAAASTQDADVIATHIESLIQQYHFDGIDFDLESTRTSYDAAFIEALITRLKTDVPNLIITGAPQILAWEPGAIGFAPVAGAAVSWDNLAKSGLFNYLFVQDYNQGRGGVIFINGSVQETQDTDPGFLAASHDDLLTSGDSQILPLPKSTHIILGVPATPASGNGMSDTSDINAELNCLNTATMAVCGQIHATTYQGPFLPHQSYSVPGLMTWSIGDDANRNPNGAWSFVNAVKSCVINHSC